MPTSKEIEIVIQAQLEQGNVIENAKNLGMGISAAIESSFEGLGERIASNLVLQMQGVLSNVKFSDILTPNNQITSQLQSDAANRNLIGPPINTPNNNSIPFTGNDARIDHASSPAPSWGGQSTGSSQYNAFPRSQGNRQSDYFIRSSFGLGYLERSEFMDVKGTDGHKFKYSELAELDRTREDLRNFTRLKKINPEEKMDEDLVKRTKEGIDSAKSIVKEEAIQIGQLNKEIPELTSVIKELSKKFEEYEKAVNSENDPQKREELKNKKISFEQAYINPETGQKELRTTERTAEEIGQYISQKRAERDAKTTEVEQRNSSAASATDFITKGKQLLDEEEAMSPALIMMQKRAKFAAGAQAVGQLLETGIGAYAKRDQYFQRVGAAEYLLNNNDNLNLLTGNLEDSFATEMLGGQEKLKEKAISDARKQAFSGLAGGAGNLLAAGALMTVGAGGALSGVGAIPGLLAIGAGGGLAISGANKFYSNALDFINPEEKALANMQNYISFTKEQNKIAFMAASATRNRSIASYTAAQGFGDKNLSEDIYGASANKNSINYGDNSLRAKAVGFGLSGQQFDSFNQTIIASMGGGNPLSDKENERYAVRDPRVRDQILRGMELYGKGFQSIPQLSSAIYNNTVNGSKSNAIEDREYALKSANDVTELAQSYGVNKMNISGLGSMVASRMESSGFGSADYELRNFKDGLSGALVAFGSGNLSGPNINAYMQTQNKLMDRSMGEDGIAIMAGIERVNSLNKNKDLQEEYIDPKTEKKISRGLQLNTFDEIALRKFKGDGKGFMAWYNKHHSGQIDEETANKIIKTYDNERISSVAKVTKDVFGGNSAAADLQIAEQTGAQTFGQLNINNDVIENSGKPKAFPLKGPVPLPKETDTSPAGEEAKKHQEAGETQLVTKGFEALSVQTATLTKKFGEIEIVMDKLAKYKEVTNLQFPGMPVGWHSGMPLPDNSPPYRQTTGTPKKDPAVKL